MSYKGILEIARLVRLKFTNNTPGFDPWHLYVSQVHQERTLRTESGAPQKMWFKQKKKLKQIDYVIRNLIQKFQYFYNKLKKT